MAGKKGQKRNLHNENSKQCKEYYYKNFPEYSEEKIIDEIKKYKRSLNYRCIEYWEAKYPELSLDQLKKLRNNKIKESHSNSPRYVEYFLKRNLSLTLEEAKLLCHQHNISNCSYNIEYYKKRFPNASIDECQEMLCNFINSIKKPDISGEKNPAYHTKTSQYERRRRSPRCIEFYQYKFPNASLEECEEKRLQYFSNLREILSNKVKDTNIEFYLNKGMSLEDAKIALHKRQSTFSLKKCIEKYGNDKGIEKFNERQIKWQRSLRKSFEINSDGRCLQSNIANKLIESIVSYLKIKKYKIEKYVYDKDSNHGYSYDFCYKKKIIEFQGDYWHCNPKIYNGDFYHKVKQLTAKDIWDKDKEKSEIANKFGYEVIHIWESDYREDPNRELKKCIEFLSK